MIRRTIVAFFATVLFAGGVTQIQAQRQTYRGTYRSVRQLLLRIENRTDVLRKSINAHGRSADHRGDAELLDVGVQDLKTAVTQLRLRVERRVASAADAREVLDRAAQSEHLVRQFVRGTSLRKLDQLSC